MLLQKRAKVMQHVILNKARAYKKSTLLIHSKIFLCEYYTIYK